MHGPRSLIVGSRFVSRPLAAVLLLPAMIGCVIGMVLGQIGLATAWVASLLLNFWLRVVAALLPSDASSSAP